VVSHNEATASRKVRQLEVAAVAEEHGIPVLLPARPADIREQLESYGAGIGVLAAYGKIVPESIIDLFPHGIINIHPSLLPKHRGPIPLESVILNGERETGVSIMQLVKAMDAGPVFGQTIIELRGDESKQELADTLLDAGGRMVVELLPDILAGKAAAMPQDDGAATYDELIRKEDGALDFSKPAAQLEREVRAYLGWPGSTATAAGKEVVITAAHALTETALGSGASGKPGSIWRDGKQFGFYTSDGILAIDSLKPAGKGDMEAASFLAGYGNRL